MKNGRTMLLGIVDSAADRQIAEVRAREVSGVFELENSLTVAQRQCAGRITVCGAKALSEREIVIGL